MPETQRLSALPAKRRRSLKLQRRLVCPTLVGELAKNLPIARRDKSVVLGECARVTFLADLVHAQER